MLRGLLARDAGSRSSLQASRIKNESVLLKRAIQSKVLKLGRTLLSVLVTEVDSQSAPNSSDAPFVLRLLHRRRQHVLRAREGRRQERLNDG